MLDVLLGNGADINARDDNGDSVLHVMVRRNGGGGC